MDKVISKTKYSRKENKKFLIFHMMHHTSTIYFMFFFLLVLIAMTVNNVLKGQNAMMSIILLGLTMGIIPFLFISKINEVVKNETPEKIKSTDTIEVTKHKFSRSNDVIPGKAVFGWNNIESFCETDDFFYIYNADNTGIFIKKADIIEGSVEDLRKLALNNLTPGKKGKLPYKRYGRVKKEYNAMMRSKKAQEKALKKANKK